MAEHDFRWHQGTKLGRTLYIDDICIGMVDTPELAKSIVDKMNLNNPKKCWRTDCGNPILEGDGLPSSDYCIEHQ